MTHITKQYLHAFANHFVKPFLFSEILCSSQAGIVFEDPWCFQAQDETIAAWFNYPLFCKNKLILFFFENWVA